MKQNKSSVFKPLLWALTLSILTGVLFFTELITMYANNINDFWFDFQILIGPALLVSFVPAFGIFGLSAALYFTLKHFKKENIYYILSALLNAGIIILYIHANFLTSMLPPLDGTEFNWGEITPNLVSIIVVLLVLGVTIFLIKKYKAKDAVKYLSYANLAIIAMLLISLITTIATTDVFKAKELTVVSSTKNLNLLSSNKNFFILMLDAVDARTFEEELKEDDEAEVALKDFTFFKDSLSGYPFTRDSVPFILSGIWNENEKPFEEYSTETYSNSEFFKTISDKYQTKNFYEEDFIWGNRDAFMFDNIESTSKDVNIKHFIKQELKYLMFKTLPFPLKRLSKIDQMDFDASRIETNYTSFVWDDEKYYYDTLAQKAEITNDSVFSFIHLEGAHVPQNLDKNVHVVEGGTDYETKVGATVTVVKGFINYLKENNAYDNSTIVILADHGYNTDLGVPGRQNPVLLIKGISETHSQMHTSKKQISFADLSSTFIELTNDKKSTEIFENIPEEGRERRYLYYVFTKEDHMVEQTTKGKAWETDKLIPTGKEFNL